MFRNTGCDPVTGFFCLTHYIMHNTFTILGAELNVATFLVMFVICFVLIVGLFKPTNHGRHI